MANLTTDLIWEMLLQLHSLIKENGSFNHNIVLKFTENGIMVERDVSVTDSHQNYASIIIAKDLPLKIHSDTVYYKLQDQYLPVNIYNTLLNNELLTFLNIYIPYCFTVLRAKLLRRCVTILHFAQTLDGKIATSSGNSKWISNNEDLLHSHRMRALSEGVLIGANTLKCDKPSLTVRYVTGPNPTRIVIGSSECDFESLTRSNGKVVFFTSLRIGHIQGIESVTLVRDKDGIEPLKILQELFRREIFSLYIEGGSITASAFLKGKSVDNLQLFLAPKIFGSGITNFLLPEISNVNDSVNFSNVIFLPMGDGMLFSGSVNY